MPILAADQRTINAIRKMDATPINLTPASRKIRVLGGGSSSNSALSRQSWLCKIGAAAGSSFNVTLHETIGGPSLGTALLQVAEKQVSATLAAGLYVAAMPHNLTMVTLVGADNV